MKETKLSVAVKLATLEADRYIKRNELSKENRVVFISSIVKKFMKTSTISSMKITLAGVHNVR